jgi:HSP20 family protein
MSRRPEKFHTNPIGRGDLQIEVIPHPHQLKKGTQAMKPNNIIQTTNSVSIHSNPARKIAAGVAIGTCLITAGIPAVLAAETPSGSGFTEKAEQWQNKMSDAFRDAWKNLRGNRSEPSVSAAAVDLREQMDSYMIRLNLPDRDLEKVEITLKGDTLRIVAPSEGKSGRYEQTLALAGADPNAPLKIERKEKDQMIVITVPKSSTSTEKNRSRVVPDPSLLPLSDWDRDFLGRMAKMSREMDRIFDESFREFRLVPEHNGFFDAPRFGSSVDIKEEGSNYVISAYLPERDIKDVNVTVEDQTLKIEAKAEATTDPEEKGKGSVMTRKARYSQLLTLPGPVQVDKMKVERKEGLITVTLPKA